MLPDEEPHDDVDRSAHDPVWRLAQKEESNESDSQPGAPPKQSRHLVHATPCALRAIVAPCVRNPSSAAADRQPLKSRVLLENCFLPGDLERQIKAFVEHYSHQLYHESINNVTPADAYFGRATAIIKRREGIKRQTLKYRRLLHRKLAA